MDRIKSWGLRLYMLLAHSRRYFLMNFFYESNLRRKFKKRVGYELNLDNPQTYNEKLQWLKARYRDPLMTSCADKVAVRSYIAEKIGEEYLAPVYGVYDSVDEIDLDALPNEFVFKSNHASGHVIICKDKSKMDWPKEFWKMRKWLLTNYFYTSGERYYRDITPRIICEKLHPGEIIDYKFVCFNRKPQYLYACSDRGKGTKINFLDLEFKPLPFRKKELPKDNLKKPENFEKMVELAGILAQDFPFVRVDFYDIDGKIYFGELTFCPGGGLNPFVPPEWDLKVGEMIDLSLAKKEFVQ